MQVIITPNKLSGDLDIISSKSDIHRSLICAAFSEGNTLINIRGNISNDIMATVKCLQCLNADIKLEKDRIKIIPIKYLPDFTEIDCNESGTSLRLLIPVIAANGVRAKFLGAGRLPKRPIEPLLRLLEKHGCKFSSKRLPFEMEGNIYGSDFEIRGDISSQFISGLLLCSPFIKSDMNLKLTSNCESYGYIDMTIDTMRKFNVKVNKKSENLFYVKNGQNYYSNKIINAQGDWSNAAFWLVLGAISGKVSCTGLNHRTSQPDSAIVDILHKFGADVFICEDKVTVSSNKLLATDIDASNIPDIIPVISVLASLSEGKTTIYNASRLRYKESDRIRSSVNMLKALGADVFETKDSMIIYGKDFLDGGVVNGYNDHRIVMSAAIASCRCKTNVTIYDAEAVRKSYPDFFSHFKMLGGIIDVV